MRPRIVVLVGLPGSGKSTYLERLGVTALASDAVRGLLADDQTDQSIHIEVFATLRYLLRRRLALERPVTYVDATHLTAVGCARPAEDAFRIAVEQLVYWLADDYAMDEREAFLLLGQVLEARCTQFVDPLYTYVAKINRQYLR